MHCDPDRLAPPWRRRQDRRRILVSIQWARTTSGKAKEQQVSQQGDIYRDNSVIPSSWWSEEIKRCYFRGLRCQGRSQGFLTTSTCCSKVILESFTWKSLDCGRKPSRCFPSAPLKQDHCLVFFFLNVTFQSTEGRIESVISHCSACAGVVGRPLAWTHDTAKLMIYVSALGGVRFLFSYSFLSFLWGNFTPHHWGF